VDDSLHADSADSATNATNAQNAVNATTADNADLLDNKDSNDFAAAYESTVVVSPTGTDTENGTALLNALTGITDASATNPYLLLIEPGTYDLGSSVLRMKDHVDIEGSGQLHTTITSSTSSACSNGTVIGANNAELSFLTVRNTGSSNCIAAIYNNAVSPRLTHVTAEAAGGAAGGATNAIGVFTIVNANLTMTNVTAVASSSGSANFGMLNDSSSPTIKQSTLTGSTRSLAQEGGTVKVANTQLVGSVVRTSGTLQCFNNYDENLAAVTCP
jgi:hypothetical protein